MRPVYKKLLLVLAILLVAGTIFFVKVWYQPHRDVKTESAISITANELLNAFIKNEKEPKYLDKAVAVTGEVMETKLNQQNKTVCLLKTDDPFFGINCTFKDNTTVTTGQKITVTGICTGYLSGADVVMIDCFIAQANN